jgi:tubby-related protein 1
MLEQSNGIYEPGRRKMKRKMKLESAQSEVTEEVLFPIIPDGPQEGQGGEGREQGQEGQEQPLVLPGESLPVLKAENFELLEEEEELGFKAEKRQKGARKKGRQAKESSPEERDARQSQEGKEEGKEESKEERKEEHKGESLKVMSFADIENLREMLVSAIPRGKILHCTIRRDKSGLNHFYPQYDVYISQGFKYMMSCKKRAGSTSSNYAFSTNKTEVPTSGDQYLGKLRSNFMGSLFNLYDTGLSCDKTTEPGRIRRNLATVEYETNIFGTNGPRKMRMYMPDADSEAEFRQLHEDWDLKAEFEKGNPRVRRFMNKAPRWNEQMKAYVLNFNGRVDKPSVKNFIMVEEGNEDENLLLFGRVGEDLFNMDIRYPLSPLQAFGIVISSFDGKLVCE